VSLLLSFSVCDGPFVILGATAGAVILGATAGAVILGVTAGAVILGVTAGAAILGVTAGAVILGVTAGAVILGVTAVAVLVGSYFFINDFDLLLTISSIHIAVMHRIAHCCEVLCNMRC
jgi:mannose/fructose/N-acetylgalactosamine-specific phosphotransferase system component IID